MKTRVYLFIVVLFVSSCKKSASDKIAGLVEEWENKEIVYPVQMYFTILGQDTVSTYPMMNSKYSIITYVDSVGCISCKLQLRKWLTFIAELDSLSDSSVPVHFFLHSKNKKEMLTILDREQFNHPVCIDANDSLNILNHFPEDMSFQTFLLDRNNKIIAIGNPILNPKIKDLYFKILFGENDIKINQNSQTKVSFSEQVIIMGDFPWKDKQERIVILENRGHVPLVINEVSTSCGCTTVEYSKEPVQSGKSMILKVKYEAEHSEHFNKTITVFCNAEGSPFQLKISGNAK